MTPRCWQASSDGFCCAGRQVVVVDAVGREGELALAFEVQLHLSDHLADVTPAVVWPRITFDALAVV